MKRIQFYSAATLLIFSLMFTMSACKHKNDEDRLIGRWNNRKASVNFKLATPVMGESGAMGEQDTQTVQALHAVVQDTIQKILSGLLVGFTCNTIDQLTLHTMIPKLGAKDFPGSYFHVEGQPFEMQLHDVPEPFIKATALFGGLVGIRFIFSMPDDNTLVLKYPPAVMQLFINQIVKDEAVKANFITNGLKIPKTSSDYESYSKAYDAYLTNLVETDASLKLVRE